MEQVISYAQDLEDLILYHVLKGENDIFYIDAGANDSTRLSVTRFLYNKGIAHGINIDPLQACIDTYVNRERDVSICAGVGRESGKTMSLYYDSEKSTGAALRKNDYLKSKSVQVCEVPIMALKDICYKWVENGKKGGFLKLDVEGFEKEALEGMDFEWWRPAVLVIEAGPFEKKEAWEDIVEFNGYIPAMHHGANRFYLDGNCKDLLQRFEPIERIIEQYDLYIPYCKLQDCRKEYENSTSWRVTRLLRRLKGSKR